MAPLNLSVRVGSIPNLFPDPVGQPGGVWTGVFRDEFDGTTLDTSKWQPYFPNYQNFTSQNPGGAHTNTNDASYYDASKVTVANSLCTLTSTLHTTVAGLTYTSGMIQSFPDAGGGWQGTYGYFEAKFKVSTQIHAGWPSFWASCAVSDGGSPPSLIWPPEIDFMEMIDTEALTLLNNLYLPSDQFQGTKTSVDATVDHVYGCKWTASGVTWYLDGVQINTTTKTTNQPLYVIVDLGAYAPHTPGWSSMTMDIDYVRIYQ